LNLNPAGSPAFFFFFGLGLVSDAQQNKVELEYQV
jgi:hypothetical protein